MPSPVKRVRCPECNAPIRVTGFIWNKEEQNYEYELASHTHRKPATYNRKLLKFAQPSEETAKKARGWMSKFRIKRGTK